MAKGTFNQIIIIGNVGNDPEVRYLPSGAAVATFSVATEDGYKKDGEFQSETNWHNVNVFGKLAEIAKEYVRKGIKVQVVGRVKYESWEKDGKKMFATKIIGSNIILLSRLDNKSEYDNTKDWDKLEEDDSVPF